MKRGKVGSWVMLSIALACRLAGAGADPARVWILPFENSGADASVEHLEEALPALLTVALSQADRHAVVDRQHLHQVLAELSLTLQGLTAPEARHRVGRLVGATVMVGGSFVRQGGDLLVTMRASDLETGIVTATAQARGPAGQLGRLVGELYRRLAGDLGKRLPDLRGDRIDEAPVSNLHFMRGLGYYYSARPNQALAEFLHAARDAGLTDIARLWLANAYLAQAQYEHAYLELSRLRLRASRNFRTAEVDAKMRACENALSAATVKTIRDLAARPVSTKEVDAAHGE